MGRPCECGRPEQCRLCWLAENNARYQAHWGLPVTAPKPAPERAPKPAPIPKAKEAPKGGAGTEMMKMADSLKVGMPSGCSCKSLAARMDAWGVQGCLEHRAEIVAEMAANAKKVPFYQRMRAALLALPAGVALEINPLDVYGSLVDLAIRRAEDAAAPRF